MSSSTSSRHVSHLVSPRHSQHDFICASEVQDWSSTATAQRCRPQFRGWSAAFSRSPARHFRTSLRSFLHHCRCGYGHQSAASGSRPCRAISSACPPPDELVRNFTVGVRHFHGHPRPQSRPRSPSQTDILAHLQRVLVLHGLAEQMAPAFCRDSSAFDGQSRSVTVSGGFRRPACSDAFHRRAVDRHRLRTPAVYFRTVQ